MSWKREVEGIERRRELAAEHGGAEAVAKQHSLGRLTIRERIEALVDEESFREQGPIAGAAELDENGELISFAPASYVLGFAKVDGRPCVVGGEDFTQRGGSPSPSGLRKSVYAEDLACQYRLPLIRFLQGGGGSVAGTTGKGKPSGGNPVYTRHRFASIARAMGTAPVVSAAVGAVAGFPAARLVASHLAIMTRHTAQVLIAGPAVVERALGEANTKEELGSARVHERSGVVDIVVEDEEEAIATIQRFLSYLPTHVGEPAPRAPSTDDRERTTEALLDIVPRERRKIFNMRKVVKTLLATMDVRDVTEADSAIAAILALHESPIDVIITDLSMAPMNGIDLVRMVRMGRDSPNPHVPVIMLTGHTELDLVREARDVGIDEFVAKPVSVRGLYERLASITTKPRPIVRSPRYVGPDRRARRGAPHDGRERRRSRPKLEDREKLV